MSSTQGLRPLIAVIGSVDASREFAPPLKAVDQARDACRLLGAGLARGGCDLAVFSSKATYAEWDVVHGYAGACTADAPGRVAAFPPRHRDVDFALPQGSCVTLETVRDTSSEWEVAYYRRLLEADGVVLIGEASRRASPGSLPCPSAFPCCRWPRSVAAPVRCG